MVEARTARYRHIVPAKKTVVGSKVVNPQGEDLGKIEDVILDTEAGRIVYAILSFGGFLGVGNKYFAVPWQSLNFNQAETCGVLNADKKLLENAPGFDKDDWPNLADPSWSNRVFTHYGYKPYGEETNTRETRSNLEDRL
jgi:hypothetical protein